MTSDTTNAIRNSQNRTCAIPAAAPAMPVKPKIAAMIATMKNPIAQLSIEPPTVALDNRGSCKQRAVLRCRELGEQILRLALGHGGFRIAAVLVRRLPVERGVERGLAVRGHQAEGLQVFLGDFAQRPEPFKEAREMRHPLRMGANARRGGIEETAALHASYALGHERERADYFADVHVFSSPVTAEGERSERAAAWLAQSTAFCARRSATCCHATVTRYEPCRCIAI